MASFQTFSDPNSELGPITSMAVPAPTDSDGTTPAAPPSTDVLAAIGLYAENLIKAGKAAEGLQILSSVLRRGESAELWNDWACAAFACGDSQLAESGFRRALELDSKYRQAAINLVALLLGQGRFDESVPILHPIAASLTVEEKQILRQLATRM
jgi:Flp pilus assembly protein TadD